ncbi:MAG: hypothetical protein JWR38_5159 [Mucilaginibacter sp.]|nr:hypothetical protein [Mucilaginibacter sp.]
MTERKKNCKADLIIFAILLTGALISLKYSAVEPSIIFIVLLIIPSVGIVGYLWNVPSKIELSKDEMTIYYGRNMSDDRNTEGSFNFPSVSKLKWENITDLEINSRTYETYGGDDAGTITTYYSYLIITDISIDYLNTNPNQRCRIRVNRFEKKPEEILAICKQFQNERTSSSNSI